MIAALLTSYGPPEVLKIGEIEKPSVLGMPGDRLVIKVACAAINAGDSLLRSGHIAVRMFMGLLKPKRPTFGGDLAGTVVEVGKDITRFKLGDPVFGIASGSCAEYVRVRESTISLKPNNLTFVEAAAIPTVAITALQALRDLAQVQKGQKVLIYGASGGIGHIAVQLARYYQAEVTAVCSTPNLGWVKALGAHHVIDYTTEDFARSSQKYDIILDTVGKRTYYNSRGALTPTGIYVTEQFMTPAFQPIQLLIAYLTGDKRAKTHLAKPNEKDMDFIRQLAEDRHIKPVIDSCYPLDRIVDAHRYAERGHSKGKVVIQVDVGQ